MGRMIEVNKIYNMDCVEGMKLLPNECIDLTVTSPPYDNLRTYNDIWKCSKRVIKCYLCTVGKEN